MRKHYLIAFVLVLATFLVAYAVYFQRLRVGDDDLRGRPARLANSHSMIDREIAVKKPDRANMRESSTPEDANRAKPPFPLTPPIPYSQMTDKQLEHWIAYLKRKAEEYSGMADSYSALAHAFQATFGDASAGKIGFEPKESNIKNYLEQYLGRPLEMDNLTAAEYSEIAAAFKSLVKRVRERLDEAITEQTARNKKSNNS